MSSPFVMGNTDSTLVSDDLPVFIEYGFDFQNECFIFENGKHKIITENDALKVWIWKTLQTERWRYRAYDNAYGIELEQFIGAYTNNTDSSTEIERYIQEALLINPYIKSIDNILATIDGDKLSYEITLTTTYGSMIAIN